MLEQFSGITYPHQNKEQSWYQNTFFEGQPNSLLTSTLMCGGHFITLVSSAPIENGQTAYQHIFMFVEPFTTAPGPLKVSTLHNQKVHACNYVGGRYF